MKASNFDDCAVVALWKHEEDIAQQSKLAR